MVTSFHRNRVSTGYIIIDGTDLTSWTWRPFELPQLIRKTVTDPSKMTPTDYDHTIYELEGDMSDLSKVKDSELLDKKIVKRKTDTALILNSDMTIRDEIAEYLRYILELPEDKVLKALGKFDDYAAKNT